MNKIFFSLKRAHQASLKFSRAALAPFGLTPARFDMMCAVDKLGVLCQSDLARMLGVSAPTVSRMVKALVSLELVEKGWGYDYRVRSVNLTDKGMRLLKRVFREVVGPGFCELAQDMASSWSRTSRRIRSHADRLTRHLRWIRYAFDDAAIRFTAYSDRFDETRLRRPLKLVSAPPDLDEQLFETWEFGRVT